MTHTILQNEYVFGKRSTKQVECSYNLYRAVINGEDGESLDYEIEADSYGEASAKAEMLAADAMVDITYIEIYQIH